MPLLPAGSTEASDKHFLWISIFILKINTEHSISIVCSIVRYPFIKEASHKLLPSLFCFFYCLVLL